MDIEKAVEAAARAGYEHPQWAHQRPWKSNSWARKAWTACMRDAIAAALPLLPAQEWQDISTAPKDGKPFLAVWWSKISLGKPAEPHIGICWWSGSWCPYARDLTHWMPLPTAPVAIIAEERTK